MSLYAFYVIIIGVRQRFTELLPDIRDKRCRNLYFKSEQARRINETWPTVKVKPDEEVDQNEIFSG